MLDTRAGSSYASSALIDRIKTTPQRTEIRRIEMMGSTTKKVELHNVSVSSVSGKITLETEVTKIDRSELLSVDNPKYQEVINRYPHLKEVQVEDQDENQKLRVHLILGTSDYVKIKTEIPLRVGRSGEPIAEKTRFGWSLMSPGVESSDLNTMLYTQMSVTDYEHLCRLDVLGLEDSTPGDQEVVHSEFKEQLTRSEEGWYTTGLPWKGNHPIPNNKSGSLHRLSSTMKKLEKTGMIQKYHEVIQDQLAQGVVEPAEQEPTGKEFYIPHKAIVKVGRDNETLNCLRRIGEGTRQGSVVE